MAKINTLQPVSAQAVTTFKKRDDWMRGVLSDNALSHAARNAAVRLGLYLNVNRERCDPSYQQLGKALGCTRRSAIRAVGELIRQGWVGIAGSSAGHRNNFSLQWPAGGDDPVTTRNVSSDKSGAGWCQPRHLDGDDLVTERNSGLNSEENSGEDIYPPADRDVEKRDDASSEDFENFWSAYPLKKAKEDARKAFKAAIKRGISAATIVNGARRYASERAGQEAKFTKHPEKWLRGGCWDDQQQGGPPTIDGITGDIVPAQRAAKTWEDIDNKIARGDFDE
jgi:hypothetical protein